MRRGVSVRAYGGADEETASVMVGEGTGVFSKKRTGRREKKGRFVRKSTSFYSISPCSQKTKYFSRKRFDYSKLNSYFLFEMYCLSLRLIKHNFPFIPPHCGVHIAQYRGTFPDHPAQTLFDLLNLRNFALSRPIGTGQKALSLNMGDLHESDATLSTCTKRRRRKEPDFVPSEKGRMPSLENAIWATPIRLFSCPMRQMLV